MTVRKLTMAGRRPLLPEWFRTRLPNGQLLGKSFNEKNTVTDHSVTQSAKRQDARNIHECWAKKRYTFMIAGPECTRGCRFCAVGTIKTPPQRRFG